MVLSLCVQPMNWYVHENRFGFADGPMDEKTFAKVDELANWLHGEWKAGRRCLSRCQAGLNRSGILISLVLQKNGNSAKDAISLIKAKRSPNALFNKDFVSWLGKYSPKRES
jgi:protein-tyrosine phosphatase